jgi:deazaflavin-dependent oxidoreductase (nitroreductase family)
MSAALVALGGVAVRAPRATARATAAHGALLSRVRTGVLRRWFGGLPLLVLETVGRRSGTPRSVALAYVRDGSDLVVVPANAGADRTPAWWLNLRAAGVGVADLGPERVRVMPIEACGRERERLWRRLSAVAPVDRYQRRTRRRLPVVILRPL